MQPVLPTNPPAIAQPSRVKNAQQDINVRIVLTRGLFKLGLLECKCASVRRQYRYVTPPKESNTLLKNVFARNWKQKIGERDECMEPSFMGEGSRRDSMHPHPHPPS